LNPDESTPHSIHTAHGSYRDARRLHRSDHTDMEPGAVAASPRGLLAAFAECDLVGTLSAEAAGVVPTSMVDTVVLLSDASAEKLPILLRATAAAFVVVETSEFPSGRCDKLRQDEGRSGNAVILLVERLDGECVLHGVEATVIKDVAKAVESDVAKGRPTRRSSPVRTPSAPVRMPVSGRKHELAVWSRDLSRKLVDEDAVGIHPGEGGLGIPLSAFRVAGFYAAETLGARYVRANSEAKAEAERLTAQPAGYMDYVHLSATGDKGEQSPPGERSVGSRRSRPSDASGTASSDRARRSAERAAEWENEGWPPALVAAISSANLSVSKARGMGQEAIYLMLAEASFDISAYQEMCLAAFFASPPPPPSAPVPPPAPAPVAAPPAAGLPPVPPLPPIRPGRAGPESLPSSLVDPAADFKSELGGTQPVAAGAASIDPAPPANHARGLRCREIAAEVGGELIELLRPLQISEIEETMESLAGLFPHCARALAGEWKPGQLVCMMSAGVTAAFTDSGTSAALALARAPQSMSHPDRSVMVLASAVTSTGRASGASEQTAQSALAGPLDSVRRAADGIGKSREGRDMSSELARLARESGASVAAGSALRQAVHAAEMHSTLGAEVNLLLHQEKLGAAPAGKLNAEASSVWNAMVEVRLRLGAARARTFKELLPAAVDAAALVKAVTANVITLDLLGGPKKLGATELRSAAAHAWPALIALARECHPRDAADVELGLLQVANDAFDIAECGVTSARAISPPFLHMATKMEEAMLAGTPAPSWVLMRKETTLQDSNGTKLKHHLSLASRSSFNLDPAAYAKQEEARKAAAAVKTAAAAETAKVKAAADKKASDAAAKLASK
jgi:hypothetical protein